MTGTEPHAWETGLMDITTYVGLDVHRSPSRLPRAAAAARSAKSGFRERSRGSGEIGGAVEQRSMSRELLLRSRSLRLWAVSAAD
jgi:hypothetical protein